MNVVYDHPVHHHNGMYFDSTTAYIGEDTVIERGLHKVLRVIDYVEKTDDRLVIDVHIAQFKKRSYGSRDHRLFEKSSTRYTIEDHGDGPQFIKIPEPIKQPEWLEKIKRANQLESVLAKVNPAAAAKAKKEAETNADPH